MTTLTVDLDDGAGLSYMVSKLRFSAKIPIHEYTKAEYAAIPPTKWVHRKAVGPAVIMVRAIEATHPGIGSGG